MIFKVFYQETREVPPVREETKSLYIEADSVREVRKRLADRQYNIEYIEAMSDAFIEYEKQHEDQFEVERFD